MRQYLCGSFRYPLHVDKCAVSARIFAVNGAVLLQTRCRKVWAIKLVSYFRIHRSSTDAACTQTQVQVQTQTQAQRQTHASARTYIQTYNTYVHARSIRLPRRRTQTHADARTYIQTYTHAASTCHVNTRLHAPAPAPTPASSTCRRDIK